MSTDESVLALLGTLPLALIWKKQAMNPARMHRGERQGLGGTGSSHSRPGNRDLQVSMMKVECLIELAIGGLSIKEYGFLPSVPSTIGCIGISVTPYRLAAVLSNRRVVVISGPYCSSSLVANHSLGNIKILFAGLFIRCKSESSMTALHSSTCSRTTCT